MFCPGFVISVQRQFLVENEKAYFACIVLSFTKLKSYLLQCSVCLNTNSFIDPN